jgi:hypothetical protein
MAEGMLSEELGSQRCDGRWGARALMLIGALWHKFTRDLAGGYRPERHYMRGPGPKSLERDSRIDA